VGRAKTQTSPFPSSRAHPPVPSLTVEQPHLSISLLFPPGPRTLVHRCQRWAGARAAQARATNWSGHKAPAPAQLGLFAAPPVVGSRTLQETASRSATSEAAPHTPSHARPRSTPPPAPPCPTRLRGRPIRGFREECRHLRATQRQCVSRARRARSPHRPRKKSLARTGCPVVALPASGAHAERAAPPEDCHILRQMHPAHS
jgi:hypothetical protein